MPSPLLAPHAQLAWRDSSTLVIEDPAAPEARLVVANATPTLVRWLRACNGAKALPELLALAARQGLPSAFARELLTELDRAGLLALAAPDRGLAPGRTPELASPLRQDLEAIALTGLDAMETLRRRAAHRVLIDGGGRVAHALVEVLAAGHIGALDVDLRHASRREVTLRDVSAFGPFAEDVGTLPGPALRRHADARLGTREQLPRRRVAVLCHAQVDPSDELPLRLAGIPYLRVIATSRYATIGPLTLPGHTTCGACIALHRADADPLWPHVLAQFEHHRTETAAVDAVFAMAVASDVAGRLLRVIDTADPTSLVNTTWHIDRTDARPRVRRWTPHPDCSCRPDQASVA